MSGVDDRPLLYLIAGEPSGDAIGASLIRAIRSRTDGRIRFAGIGGERMAAEGIVSPIQLRELAIMGIVEVLPRARRLLRLVRDTAHEIDRLAPVALITIDSSGFCFRVAEKLHQKPRRPLLIHYVAPMVWAWREHRAREAARWYDHLLTLLPFEPPHFAKVGLPTSYVGHPVIEGGADRGDGIAFRSRHGIPVEVPLLVVLPGSRRGEVRRLLPVFRDTVHRIAGHFPTIQVVVPTVETVAQQVARGLADWPVRTLLVRGHAEKFDAFAAGNVALAASGTVALELAMAGLPMVIGYKTWIVTAWALKFALKVRHVSLINILLDRGLIPELLQGRCEAVGLAAEIETLLTDEGARHAQTEGAAAALQSIGRDDIAPSLRAADRILELIAARNAGSSQS
jgi:lipid-A-disaccharide synthase